MAALVAVVTQLLATAAGSPCHALVKVVWTVDLVLSVVSGLGLVLTGVNYLWYRRHGAELDAAGADVMTEWHARGRRDGERG